MTSQYGQCRNIVGSFLFRVLPVPATPPYSVRPLHMHGATGYGGYQLGALKVLVVRSCGWFKALCGDLGGENPDEAGSFQNCWAALAAKVANMQPKERN